MNVDRLIQLNSGTKSGMLEALQATDWIPNRDIVEACLSHPIREIREAILERNDFSLTKDQVGNLLLERDSRVLSVAVKRSDFSCSSELLDGFVERNARRGAVDSLWENISERSDLPLSAKTIDFLAERNDVCARNIISGHANKLDEQQRQRMLDNPNENVRYKCADEKLFSLDRKQWLTLLFDEVDSVVQVAIRRKEFNIDEETKQKFLNGKSNLTVAEMMHRNDVSLTKSEQGKLADRNDRNILFALVRRADVDAEIAKRFFSSDDVKVVLGLAENEAVSLSAEETDMLTCFSSLLVRQAIAARKTFIPTDEQLDHGLTDSSKFVRTTYESRVAEWTAKRQSGILLDGLVSSIEPRTKRETL